MTPDRFARLKAVLDRRQPDLTVLTDDVHKSHNVAAVLRSCDAVGVHRLHAVSPGGDLRRHHMISGGSKRWVETIVHERIEDALEVLRSGGFTIAVAHSAETARDYRDIDYTARTAIVLGAELEGPSNYALSEADLAIRIPMQGMVESLNVSVAAAVILFEAQRQRLAAGLYGTRRIDDDEYRETLFEWAYPEIAERCREKRIPYPALDDDGQLLENPLRSA